MPSCWVLKVPLWTGEPPPPPGPDWTNTGCSNCGSVHCKGLPAPHGAGCRGWMLSWSQPCPADCRLTAGRPFCGWSRGGGCAQGGRQPALGSGSRLKGRAKSGGAGICAPGWARGLSSCSGNREVPPSTRKAAEWTKSLQNSLFPKLRL